MILLRPLVILAIVALAFASGCATVSFKRGAGPGDAKADEDACRATSQSPEAYADCLRAKGWMVRSSGAGSAAAPVAAPEPTPPAVAEPSPVPQPTPLPGGKPKTPPAKATPAPVATSGAAAKPAAPAAAAPSAKASPQPLDPNAHVTVQSWWKLGGTAAGLDLAIDACVKELGAAHRPSPAATDVTVALRDCLRRAKWFPVGGTGAK
jgi:hypothetical protein